MSLFLKGAEITTIHYHPISYTVLTARFLLPL